MKSKKSAVFAAALSVVLSSLSGAAFAEPTKNITLKASEPSIQVTLDGVLEETKYRTEPYEGTCYRDEEYTDTCYRDEPYTGTCTGEESYQDTCYRDEPYTEYEQRCEPKYETECHSNPPSCSPVCRDVMRPVCDSNGCKDFNTRECTQECSGGGQSCSQVRSGETCSQQPVTRYRNAAYSCTKTRPTTYSCTQYRSVPYSCTKTHEVPYGCTLQRQVPDGTNVVEHRTTNVTVKLEGDVSTLSGKDVLKVATANGVDTSKFDASVALVKSADTHLIYLTKTSSTNRDLGGDRVEYNVEFAAKLLDKSKVKVPVTKIDEVNSNSSTISFTASGAKIDKAVKVNVKIAKNKFIGPWKEMVNTDVTAPTLRLSALNGGKTLGQIDVSDLGYRYNKRPHRVSITLSRDISDSLGKDLLNPGILKTMNLGNETTLQTEGKFGKM